MYKISTYLDQEHRRCDAQYAMAESDVNLGKWDAARKNFGIFIGMFEGHLDKEERVLFPRLDHALGNGYGPSVVMREEHRQMRIMIVQIEAAIARHDYDAYHEQSSNLRALVRQHHLKEERLLHPQADFLLIKQADAIIAAMENLYHVKAA
ncbi:hemerythrin domain-containing protein [Duganella radicis]|uniref:Hemerythrin domain-containing protein n=1 Tax=Duganella radicis TaxID=551988 RepID=A0A6L6PS02_9BURK|nr:hemerythrin domain-containing protein [Duganella radicis]MTV41614.1 hemerythrin domain-containing protein [Duganella radicis]